MIKVAYDSCLAKRCWCCIMDIVQLNQSLASWDCTTRTGIHAAGYALGGADSLQQSIP
jgi:hypothetical protein